MKKNYTLNNFYSQVKSLIEKHNCTDPGCNIRVQFEIAEDLKKNGRPRLDCTVSYERDHEFVFFSSASTPETALCKFEEELTEARGLMPQTVSVDLDAGLALQEILAVQEN